LRGDDALAAIVAANATPAKARGADWTASRHSYPYSNNPLGLATTTATKKPALSLFNELKRRNVFRVGAAYVVVAWLIIQVVETIFPAFRFGDAAIRIATIVLAIGLIPALIFAWAFELTP